MNAIFIGSRPGEHIQRVGKKGMETGGFSKPQGITTGPDDDIVVCDAGNRRVQVLDKNGLYKHHFGEKGQELGKFLNSSDVVVDKDNNILVSDWEKNVIQVFSYDGSFISYIDSEGDKWNHPLGLAAIGDGHVIVADQYNHHIKKYQYMM